MPHPARDRYHHGNLREALIVAGVDRARTGGEDAVTLRDVTRHVGVSASAAYRHFADRDALVAAVADRIRHAMADRMRAFEPNAATGRERLRAVGLGYIAFAREEPGLFETAFATITALPAASTVRTDDTPTARAPDAPPTDEASGAPDAPTPEASGAPEPLAALSAALDTLVTDGELDAADRPGAEWPCWSAVHGFARLWLRGPLRQLPAAEVDAAAARTVDTAIAGLLASTRATPLP